MPLITALPHVENVRRLCADAGLTVREIVPADQRESVLYVAIDPLPGTLKAALLELSRLMSERRQYYGVCPATVCELRTTRLRFEVL